MDLNKFEEFFKNGVNDIKSLYKEDIKFKVDHISLLTTSLEDYEKAKVELKDQLVNLKEVPHCGRRLTIADLKTPLTYEGFNLNRLELTEPKPSKVVTERKIDHVAFVPEDYKEFIKYSKEHKIDLYDEMEIGNVILCKLKAPNSKIEFRSSSDFGMKEKSNVRSEDIEKYKLEAEENKEKALRALADYQNLKKRIDQDKEAFTFIANTAMIAKLLDINDDFSRANEFVLKEEDHNKVKSAYKSVHDKLSGILSDFGLEEISLKEGDKFNMHTMEAIGTVNTDNEEENDLVKHIASKGYKYSGRDQIVRPVRVIVSKFQDTSKPE